MAAPKILLAVLMGGCVGGLARYGVTSALPAAQGFPWSTLMVNLVGCFLLALLLVVVLELLPTSTYLRPLLGTGFCGAFTTFSAVTVATVELARDGSALVGATYVAASLLGGLATGAAGLIGGRLVVRRLNGEGSRA